MVRLTARSRLALLYTALVLATSVVLTALTFVLVRRRVTLQTSTPDRLVTGDGGQLSHLADEVRAEIFSALMTQSAIALAIVALLAVVLGWLVAGRILRPIRAISATAQRLSAEYLAERVPVTTPADEISALIGTINGMLDRIERGVRERDRLLASQRMFVANAAHELRTPLTTMRTAIDVTLDGRPGTDELLAMAADIRDAVERSQRTLDGLLTLARSQTGPTRQTTVDLAQLAAQIIAATDPAAREVALHADLRPAPVSGEPVLIERAITNLLDNAVYYNHPGGNITITTGTIGDRAYLRVANTGEPIAPDEVDRLFEPFVRGAADRTNADGGTGLGLSIVRAIVTAHHGELSVVARPGGGLDVTTRLPVSSAARPGRHPAGGKAPGEADRTTETPSPTSAPC